jgi:hypothetical protein
MLSIVVLTYMLSCLVLSLILTASWPVVLAETESGRRCSILRHRWAIALFAAVIMPYLVWYMIFSQLERQRRLQTLRQVGRSYRPYEFVRVNNLELAAPIREQFELHSPPLIKLGYELIADFRMKPEPVEVYDRIFFSSDGRTIAAVTALLGSGAMGLISVLQDGTVVHTTSARNPRPQRKGVPSDQLCITYLPDAAVQEVHDHHQNTLKMISELRETTAMRFRHDQFREVMAYDQLIFCRWRYRHGDLADEPPSPDFRTLRAMSGVLDLAAVRERI